MQTVLVTGVRDPTSLRSAAIAAGVEVSGDVVLRLRGPIGVVATLPVGAAESISTTIDEAVEIDDAQDLIVPDEQALYMARRDFGLVEYNRDQPSHDGRNVRVGLLDDGVSPLNKGLMTTTTGARKLIARASRSSLLQTVLIPQSASDPPSPWTSSFPVVPAKTWQGVIHENPNGLPLDRVDLNGDGQYTDIDVGAFETSHGYNVCVDVNGNHNADKGECVGTFARTGEYGYWTANKLVAFTAEFDQASGIVTVSQGERDGDDHGNGVASVMTGHGIGGQFDGVAPGAQLLDYNIADNAIVAEEERYTLGMFLRGLEWMGQQGAEVVNISYALHFMCASTQSFMQKALDAMIEKYNFVLCFSAGNGGPGLGSYNRGMIVPADALSVGAFASSDLYEYVHGTAGLPAPGRIPYYSNRGPSPDGGSTPSVIAPMASVVYGNTGAGYRGFSGTSSASPAVAGLAAVLISAEKQKGTPIDASAVVHAIRKSAEPLPGVPFVEQGTGLPKIDRALRIYEDLISARDFARIVASTNDTGPDSVIRTGIFLKTSDTPDVYETSVQLRAATASSVTPSQGSALLKQVRVEYSHPWLSGPTRSFLSVGSSRLSTLVDIKAAFAGAPARGGERFGEIRIIDDQTNARLHVVPVTIIDDVPLDAPYAANASILPEEVVRYHINVKPGTTGFRLRTEVVSGDEDTLVAMVYGPWGSVLRSKIGASTLSDSVIETTAPGWYQVAYAKSKGASNPIVVQTSIEPVTLTLSTSALSVEGPNVRITNHGSRQEVKLVVEAAPTLVGEQVVSADVNALARVRFPLAVQGDYVLSAETAIDFEASSWQPACVATLRNAAGSVISTKRMARALSLKASSEHVGGHVELECRPFESDGKDSAGRPIVWKFSARVVQPSAQGIWGTGVARLVPGVNRVPITWTKAPPRAGESARVTVVPIFEDDGALDLGTLVTY